jgi:hypothetical protein
MPVPPAVTSKNTTGLSGCFSCSWYFSNSDMI